MKNTNDFPDTGTQCFEYQGTDKDQVVEVNDSTFIKSFTLTISITKQMLILSYEIFLCIMLIFLTHRHSISLMLAL